MSHNYLTEPRWFTARNTEASMPSLDIPSFILGIMAAWTPSLLWLAFMLWRNPQGGGS